MSYLLAIFLWVSLWSGREAWADKLRVCVGDFPPYAIGLEFLQQQKQDYEVSQSTVYACSVRYKKNYFDLILGDSYIYVTNYLDNPDNRIVSLVDYSDGVDQIIVQKDSNPAKISGSRWALQKGTMSTVLLSLYLRGMQLTLRDVLLEDVKVENTPQAIGRTRFYGAVNWQPYARKAVERGGRVVATSADFHDKLFDFVVTRKSAINRFGPQIQAYVRERLRLAQNMAQVGRRYAEMKNIPLTQAEADLSGLHIYSSKAEVLQDQERVQRSLKLAAEVADISQYSGTQRQEQLKQRDKDIFDFSLVQ